MNNYDTILLVWLKLLLDSTVFCTNVAFITGLPIKQICRTNIMNLVLHMYKHPDYQLTNGVVEADDEDQDQVEADGEDLEGLVEADGEDQDQVEADGEDQVVLHYQPVMKHTGHFTKQSLTKKI